MSKQQEPMSVSDTRSFWKRGGAGQIYEKEFKGLIGSYVDESELKPIHDLVQGLRNSKVLDIGCGTGRHLTLFSPDNELHGIDISPEMLALAAQKVPGARLVAGSADDLPFADNSFDLVLSSRVAQHMRDQGKYFKEMCRVCKPGGRIILLSYNSWSPLCLYKQTRMSRVGRVLNLAVKPILGRRSFLNPWGFTYDNYCSIPEISRHMRNLGVRRERVWGATIAQPWFLNDLFVGKILEKFCPPVLKVWLGACLYFERTLVRVAPFKYTAEKIVWVGIKER